MKGIHHGIANLNLYPHKTHLQQTTIKTSRQKYGKISIHKSIIIENTVMKSELEHYEHSFLLTMF